VNRFDSYISDYLYSNSEVSLEKIGTIKTSAVQDQQAGSVVFVYDKRIATSQELINFIAEKESKNRHLIFSDLESHLAQVREFLNIGKSYEIPNIGFIKANNSGVYEFLPYSEVNKPVKTGVQPAKRQKQSNRSAIQLITLLIVLAILGGLGWQAYQFFSKSKTTDSAQTVTNTDTTVNAATPVQDSNHTIDSTLKTQQQTSFSDSNTVNVKYIFETTASVLRAQTRTAQLKGFGNDAGYDSFVNNNTKFYSLYILKPTKITDTLTVKDSIAKFLQKDINLKIVR
jgi:hypothetical protein